MKFFAVIKGALCLLILCCLASANDILRLSYDTYIGDSVQFGKTGTWYAPGGKLGNGERSQPSIDEIGNIISDAFSSKNIGDWRKNCFDLAKSVSGHLTAANRNWLVAVQTVYNFMEHSDTTLLLKESLDTIAEKDFQNLMNNTELDQAKRDIKIYFRDLKMSELLTAFMERKSNPENSILEDIQDDSAAFFIADVGMMKNGGKNDDSISSEISEKLGPDRVNSSGKFKAGCQKLVTKLSSIQYASTAVTISSWIEQQPVENIPGLKNEGNTCYFNAVIQALYSCDVFKDIVRQYGDSVSQKILTLFGRIESSTDPFPPNANGFLDIIDSEKTRFPRGRQQDANELLVAILEAIDGGLDKKLSLKLRKGRNCSCCGDSRFGLEDIKCVIPVPMHLHTNNLADLFGLIFDQRGEKLTDYVCDSCGKRGTTTQHTSIADTMPELLILSLNRFGYDKSYGRTQKITDAIEYQEVCSFNGTSYQLKAVVRHSGCSVDSGHYIADVRRANQWYEANDSATKKITKPTQDDASFQGYIFFYEKTSGHH